METIFSHVSNLCSWASLTNCRKAHNLMMKKNPFWLTCYMQYKCNDTTIVIPVARGITKHDFVLVAPSFSGDKNIKKRVI